VRMLTPTMTIEQLARDFRHEARDGREARARRARCAYSLKAKPATKTRSQAAVTSGS
jgi:hypothetical protein